jgi:proteasome accessory factor B
MILGALLHRQRLRLHLREHSLTPPVATTVFDLYRLAWLQGQWALVGYSSAEHDIRIYWLPWIEAVQPTSEAYSIPPRFNLARYLKRLRPPRAGPATNVHLRFSARVAPLIFDMPAQSGQRIDAAPDGAIDFFLTVEAVDQILNWVLGFGDQVQVIEPEELKNAVCDWAERIIRQYQK